MLAEVGSPIVLADGVIKTPADGETYHDVERRLTGWIADTDADPGDRLVISHGNSSRVLRGMLAGLAPHPLTGTPFASGLPQGSVSLVVGGEDTVAHTGTGHAPPT